MPVCGHQSVARDVMLSGLRNGTCCFKIFRTSRWKSEHVLAHYMALILYASTCQHMCIYM